MVGHTVSVMKEKSMKFKTCHRRVDEIQKRIKDQEKEIFNNNTLLKNQAYFIKKRCKINNILKIRYEG